MRRRVVANLVLAQVSFFSFLAVAIFMTTSGFQHNRGLSFYGEHWSTAMPYGAGFFFCDYFLLRAGNALPKDVPRCKRLSLLIDSLTVLMLVVLLTPDTVNSLFNTSHSIACSILFLYELSFATWLAVRCFSDGLVWSLLALQLTAGVLAMLSQLHVIFYLSEGILVFQLIFSVLMIRSVSRFLTEPSPSPDSGQAQNWKHLVR